MMHHIEEHLTTRVCGEYDVVVAGGGVAGVSAAVSAARLGQKVLLLEKGVVLGGLATVGMISWYEPLSDGPGRHIMHGIPEELLQLSIRYGGDTLHPDWKNGKPTSERRYATHFSPTLFAMALDAYVLDAGVEMLLDTLCVGTQVENGKLTSVLVETKDGRRAYRAKAFVDATGDADLAQRAGIPCELGKNYLSYVAQRASLTECGEALSSQDIMKLRNWRGVGSNLFGGGHPEGYPHLAGVTPEDVTKFVLDGRKMFFDSVKDEPRSSRDILAIPGMAQFRTTRRIQGAATLKETDAWQHCDESIGVLCDFTKPSICYEMPYGALYHPMIDNLFAAGRIVSAEGWGWDAARVIPGAALTGQAAGIAAALRCQNAGSSTASLYPKLAEVLQQAGLEMHL